MYTVQYAVTEVPLVEIQQERSRYINQLTFPFYCTIVYTYKTYMINRVQISKESLNTGQSVLIPCHSQTRTKHADLVTLET